MSDGFIIKRYATKREAAWLIDIGYVVKAASFKLDYFKTLADLQSKHTAVHAFIFNGFDPRNEIDGGLKSFYTAATAMGFTIRLHPMLVDPMGKVHQKRVDVDMAAHLLLYSTLPEVSHVYLTTGDSDLMPAVELARTRFKTSLMLLTYEKNVSQDLITLCTGHQLFDKTLHGRDPIQPTNR